MYQDHTNRLEVNQLITSTLAVKPYKDLHKVSQNAITESY